MITSFDLLPRLFQIKDSVRFNTTLKQIDSVSLLVQKILGCDFVALFYRKGEHDNLIPISCRNWNVKETHSLNALEQYCQIFLNPNSKNLRGIQDLTGTSVDHASEKDIFAQENGFSTRFTFPFYQEGYLCGMIIAYWKTNPDTESFDYDHILNPLGEVFVSAMTSTEEMQVIGNYSHRLAVLISLFDLPLDKDRTSELLADMLRTAISVSPDCNAGLVVSDPISGDYSLLETAGNSAPDMVFAERLAVEVGQILSRKKSPNDTEKDRFEIGLKFDREKSSIIVVELLQHPTQQYGIVFWTGSKEKFSEEELSLISVFRLFARTILTNALLVRDLTKAQAKLKESSNRFANMETMAALADMSAGVAHDFNNIIGAIVGRLQLLKMKATDDQLIKSLDRLEASALEGAETVKRLQQFSVAVKDKNPKPVDLASLVNEYMDDPNACWRTLAEEKQVIVEWTSDLADMSDAMVGGDKKDLITVLEHLIQNGVEFAPEKSKVLINLGPTNKGYSITVSDDGPGIPDAIRNKIFYPFFSTKNTRGAGLGLSVVYGVVNRLGGKVSFSQGLNKGTVFTVLLNRLEASKEQSDVFKKTQKIHKLNILVVDDDEQIREVLSDMLMLDGHTTTACHDGYSALQTIENQKFDIVITDLGMPGMSGLDMAGIIHESKPEIPIAMITGWGTQLNHDEMALKGVKAVLSKPFHLKDVKSLVSELASSPNPGP